MRMVRNTKKILLPVLLFGMLFLAAIWGLAVWVHVPRTQIPMDQAAVHTEGSTTVYIVDLPPLSDEDSYSLMFKSIGNVITVRANGAVLYTYGQELADRHRDIGRIHAAVDIPRGGYNACHHFPYRSGFQCFARHP